MTARTNKSTLPLLLVLSDVHFIAAYLTCTSLLLKMEKKHDLVDKRKLS